MGAITILRAFTAALISIAALAVPAEANETSRKAISPTIYGVNHAGSSQLASVPYPVNRWGGSSTTRYNWQADVSNRAADWFFMNIPEPSLDPAQLPDGSTADQLVSASLAAGAEPPMTMPLIGWTPLPIREKRWGFSEL